MKADKRICSRLVYNLSVHVTLIYIPAHGAGGGLAYKLKG